MAPHGSCRDVGTAQLRRSGCAPRRGDVLRARPRDHRRRPQQRHDHRDRCRQGPRRRVPGHVPDPRQPRSGDPTADQRAHRAHRCARLPGPAHRRRARLARRLHRRRRVRRPQRRLRPRVLARGARTRRPIDDRPDRRRHGGTRPPARARRGSRLPPRNARQPVPSRPPPDPPRPRRRARHDRPPPPAARACRRPRRARTRRPRRPRQARGAPAVGQVEADRAPPALPWRVPVLRSPRRGPVRRQGDQPPPAGPQLLRQRRPSQDRPDAARDPGGQASRAPRCAVGRGRREPPDREHAPPLQPRRHARRQVLLHPPRHRLRVAAPRGRARTGAHRRAPRTAAVADDGVPRRRGDPLGVAVAALLDPARTPPRRRRPMPHRVSPPSSASRSVRAPGSPSRVSYDAAVHAAARGVDRRSVRGRRSARCTDVAPRCPAAVRGGRPRPRPRSRPCTARFVAIGSSRRCATRGVARCGAATSPGSSTRPASSMSSWRARRASHSRSRRRPPPSHRPTARAASDRRGAVPRARVRQARRSDRRRRLHGQLVVPDRRHTVDVRGGDVGRQRHQPGSMPSSATAPPWSMRSTFV